MDNRYFSRVYFSRYFYSSFKGALKTRIKITRVEDFYFYSDPYYLNSNLNKSQKLLQNPTAPIRSYFFPLFFKEENLNNFYDLGWFTFYNNREWRVKFFSLFLKLKIFNFFQVNFIKLYLNFFINSSKK